MGKVYATESLGGNRRQAWQEIISRVFVPLDLNIEDAARFSGRLTQSALADLELIRTCADPESSRRTRRHTSCQGSDDLLLVLVKRGRVNVVQYDHDILLGPDSFCLLDLNEPYVFRHPERMDAIFVKGPKATFGRRVTDPRRQCAVARPVRNGLARVGMGFLEVLASQADHVDPAIVDALAGKAEELLELLWLAEPDHPAGGSIARIALHRRAVAFVDRHFADPTLDPNKVAAGLGVSVRYLHRVFQDSNDSVGQYLRRRRLKRSYEELTDPGYEHLRVNQIAARNGFADPNHFSAAFKNEFGISARDLRRTTEH